MTLGGGGEFSGASTGNCGGAVGGTAEVAAGFLTGLGGAAAFGLVRGFMAAGGTTRGGAARRGDGFTVLGLARTAGLAPAFAAAADFIPAAGFPGAAGFGA